VAQPPATGFAPARRSEQGASTVRPCSPNRRLARWSSPHSRSAAPVLLHETAARGASTLSVQEQAGLLTGAVATNVLAIAVLEEEQRARGVPLRQVLDRVQALAARVQARALAEHHARHAARAAPSARRRLPRL